MPTDAYTPWLTRALAFLIDWTPIWLVFVVPMIGCSLRMVWVCAVDPLPPQPPPQQY